MMQCYSGSAPYDAMLQWECTVFFSEKLRCRHPKTDITKRIKLKPDEYDNPWAKFTEKAFF